MLAVVLKWVHGARGAVCCTLVPPLGRAPHGGRERGRAGCVCVGGGGIVRRGGRAAVGRGGASGRPEMGHGGGWCHGRAAIVHRASLPHSLPSCPPCPPTARPLSAAHRCPPHTQILLNRSATWEGDLLTDQAAATRGFALGSYVKQTQPLQEEGTHT